MTGNMETTGHIWKEPRAPSLKPRKTDDWGGNSHDKPTVKTKSLTSPKGPQGNEKQTALYACVLCLYISGRQREKLFVLKSFLLVALNYRESKTS